MDSLDGSKWLRKLRDEVNVSADNPSVRAKDCEICDNRGYISGTTNGLPIPYVCTCYRGLAFARQRYERFMQSSLLPKDYTFQSFAEVFKSTDGKMAGLLVAQYLAENLGKAFDANWIDNRLASTGLRRDVSFVGGAKVGKTGLAIACGNEVLRGLLTSVRYADTVSLVAKDLHPDKVDAYINSSLVIWDNIDNTILSAGYRASHIAGIISARQNAGRVNIFVTRIQPSEQNLASLGGYGDAISASHIIRIGGEKFGGDSTVIMQGGF